MNRHPAHYIGPAYLVIVGLSTLVPLTLMALYTATLMFEGTPFEMRGPLYLLPLVAASGLSCWYGAYRWWKQPDR